MVSPLTSRKASYGLCEAAAVHKTGLLVDERHFKAKAVHKTGLLVDGRHFKPKAIARTRQSTEEGLNLYLIV